MFHQWHEKLDIPSDYESQEEDVTADNPPTHLMMQILLKMITDYDATVDKKWPPSLDYLAARGSNPVRLWKLCLDKHVFETAAASSSFKWRSLSLGSL